MATHRPIGPAQSIVKLLLLASSVLPLWGKPIWFGGSTSDQRIAASNLAALFQINLKNNASTFNQIPRDSPKFWWMMGVIIFLVLLGGCFAGLTLGLMGLDMLNLRVLSTSGSVTEQEQALAVLKLLERGRHWVLVVLLLSNVVVNETLPIFLDSVLGGGAAAILISTGLIVIFGEIIPQSVCVRYGLSIGAKSAPFVLALMYLEFPIAYPIALLLDYILGHDEGTTYKKAELKTFVGLHRHIGTDGLNEDEVTIISAVLDLSDKTIVDIMTPIEETFTLAEDSILDETTVTELVSQGYSRVPVHEAGQSRNFIGMLLVKHLISYDPEDAKPVCDFQLSPLPEGSPEMTCLEALNFFQQGRSHMMLVSSQPGENGGALGVVSLEDVIEEMIGEEIIDETDQYVDVAHKIKVVRRPLTNRSSTKGLAPLIKGVIEKRKHTSETVTSRSSSESIDGGQPREGMGLMANHYGSLASAYSSNRSSVDLNSSTQSQRRPRAIDKVKIKVGENPTSRSQSETRKKIIPATNGDVIEEESSSHAGSESGDQPGESTPLLNGKDHERETLLPSVGS